MSNNPNLFGDITSFLNVLADVAGEFIDEMTKQVADKPAPAPNPTPAPTKEQVKKNTWEDECECTKETRKPANEQKVDPLKGVHIFTAEELKEKYLDENLNLWSTITELEEELAVLKNNNEDLAKELHNLRSENKELKNSNRRVLGAYTNLEETQELHARLEESLRRDVAELKKLNADLVERVNKLSAKKDDKKKNEENKHHDKDKGHHYPKTESKPAPQPQVDPFADLFGGWQKIFQAPVPPKPEPTPQPVNPLADLFETLIRESAKPQPKPEPRPQNPADALNDLFRLFGGPRW